MVYSITFVKPLHRMEHNFFGRCKMISVTLELPPEVALFYTRVACSTGKTTEQVICDALFRLAGELSLEALRSRQKD